MKTLTAKRVASAAREVPSRENLWASDVARNTLSTDVTTARRGANGMEVALISLCTQIDNYLGPSNWCRSNIRSGVDSRVDTFMPTLYETCHENVMSLRGNNDCNVDCSMAAVHRHLLGLRDSADTVHARTQPPSVADPPESYLGGSDPR